MDDRLLVGIKKLNGELTDSWESLNRSLAEPFATGRGFQYWTELQIKDAIKDSETTADKANETEQKANETTPTTRKFRTIRFGLISDTHLGSKNQQITHLKTAYDRFKEQGIKDVYHAGDFFEGIKMRPGHEQECFLHGVDEMVDYAVANYPYRPGIKTRFISGNHDASTIKTAGVDACALVAEKREDLVYLGKLNTRVKLAENCILELNHPLDGSSYAYSHASQKFIDAIDDDDKPDILATGHHHKYITFMYRGVHALEVPCFQWLTSWMKGKRLRAEYGSLILNVDVDEYGKIIRCVPEYFPFGERIKCDY